MENVFYQLANHNHPDWGIKVHTCGHQKVAPKETYPTGHHPKSHQFTVKEGRRLRTPHLVYIVEGSGHFYTNIKK